MQIAFYRRIDRKSPNTDHTDLNDRLLIESALQSDPNFMNLQIFSSSSGKTFGGIRIWERVHDNDLMRESCHQDESQLLLQRLVGGGGVSQALEACATRRQMEKP